MATDDITSTATPEGAEMLLEVKNLSTDFVMKRGTVNAVIDVSFSVRKGEVLAIVGESGSGKSVTSLSVMGLLQPPGRVTSGEIVYKGRNLLDLPKSEMRAIRGNHISMIFQEPMTSLNPVFTIENQLTESIREHMKLDHKAATARAIDMLRLVGIPSPEKRIWDYPHQMSGGMRQRVMTAMALSCDPDLLIADEPTTALDVTIQAQILELLNELKAKLGMAILLITHDMGVIAETADRVAVMYAGRLVEVGPVREVIRQPRHPYTVGLMGSIPGVHRRVPRLVQIDGAMPRLNEIPSGCAFHPRCPFAMDICKQVDPVMVAVGPNHTVRCHLFPQPALAGSQAP